MKKYILLAAMSLLCGSSFATTLKTKVYFGAKDASGCKQASGICEIVTGSSVVGSVPASFDLNSEGTQLTMSITDADVIKLPGVVYDDFMNGYFNMEALYAIPADIITALQGSSDITLQKGQYTVAHTGGNYIVTFRL